MRIGFLFNHDAVHQIAHSLPIAIALAARAPALEIVLAASRPELAVEIRRLLRSAGADLNVVELPLRSRVRRLGARLLDPILPASRLAIYGDNLDFFRSLDMLVVAEKTSALLRTHYGLPLTLVHTRHGAGDRAIGFDRASAAFDHVLVAGPALRDRLHREAGIPHHRMSIVGYPKFDLPPVPRVLRLPKGRPTILYNPHVSPHLSSWYRHGKAILDHFAGSSAYNLIFAPHVLLFRRPLIGTIRPVRLAWPGSVGPAVRGAWNVHVDLGSAASTDMTYTDAADIYLGDASSQVYEFIRRPRPCLFFDSHGGASADDRNFAHWGAGRVVRSIAQLQEALDDAVRVPTERTEALRRLFSSHIDLSAEPSSVRAARVIERLAATRKPRSG